MRPIRLLLIVTVLFSSESASAAEGFIVGVAEQLGDAVNTDGVEMGPSLSSDGLSLYFTRGIEYPTPFNADGTERTSGDRNNDIFVSTRPSIGSPWGEPTLLAPPVTDAFWEENSPEVSADGEELFFADGYSFRYLFQLHHRDGGLGRADLWSSRWDAGSAGWSEPENLGPLVNSEYEDFAPSISADRLSLYFTSYRPGGSGSADIWVARRESVDAPWGEPENLGPQVNSDTIEQAPSVSTDGSLLFFSRLSDFDNVNFDLFVSARNDADGTWGAPINLASDVSTEWLEVDPEVSHDGAFLYFSRRVYTDLGSLQGESNLWRAPLHPLEPARVTPGDVYQESFDESLGVDAAAGSSLPLGWTTTDNDLIHRNATSSDFPPERLESSEVVNAGRDGLPDRALAVGVPSRDPQAPTIQFLSEVELADAAAMQLEFNVEAWAADRRSSDLAEPTFDVIVEANSGEGFSTLFEYRDVGGDLAVASPQGGGVLDGNQGENRAQFSSGTQIATLPQGTTLRVRWNLPEESEARGWVFGIDDFNLQLFDSLVSAFDCSGDGALGLGDADCTDPRSLTSTLASANLALGDLDGDGAVALGDFEILKEHFGAPGFYTNGDLNLDGVVRLDDFVLFKANFGKSAETAEVPEPMSMSLLAWACAGSILLLCKMQRGRRPLEADSK